MVERFSQYTRVPCVVSEVRLHGTSPLLARARPSGGLFESQERDSRVWPNRSPKILEHRALCRRWDFVRQPPLVLALPLSRCLWCMRSSLACVRLAITHSRVGISFPAGFTYSNGTFFFRFRLSVVHEKISRECKACNKAFHSGSRSAANPHARMNTTIQRLSSRPSARRNMSVGRMNTSIQRFSSGSRPVVMLLNAAPE